MRLILIALGLVCTVPTFALAQDAVAGCTTLAVVQSQGCLVRQVFVCEDAPDDVINVGSYGLDGATALAIFNADGWTLMTGVVPGGTAKAKLGEQADPLSLRVVLATGQDSFDYQMIHDTAGATRISGQITTSGEKVIVDGRSLQVLLSNPTTVNPAGETETVFVRYLYDADLRLMFTDTISDPATGEIRITRTPVEFIMPGEVGFDDYTPLHGCEG